MGKESDFENFIEILREATSRIEREYFLLSVAGSEDEIYRERVYCYELYHRLRGVFEASEFQYSLAGEVDKNGHTIIYPKLGAKKPDLIVHVPRDMDWNLVVIEVKPIGTEIRKAKKDLETLIGFLDHAQYYRAIHLVYGGNEKDIKEYVRKVFEMDQLKYSNLLYLYWHKSHGRQAQRIEWGEVISSKKSAKMSYRFEAGGG
jgi:hypothetical protein